MCDNKCPKCGHTFRSVPTDEQVLAAARRMYEDEGKLEIGETGCIPSVVVSRSDGNESEGAYALAWVWVPDDEAWQEEVK